MLRSSLNSHTLLAMAKKGARGKTTANMEMYPNCSTCDEKMPSVRKKPGHQSCAALPIQILLSSIVTLEASRL